VFHHEDPCGGEKCGKPAYLPRKEGRKRRTDRDLAYATLGGSHAKLCLQQAKECSLTEGAGLFRGRTLR